MDPLQQPQQPQQPLPSPEAVDPATLIGRPRFSGPRPALRVAITGAAGQLAYALYAPLLRGDIFGPDQVGLPSAYRAWTTAEAHADGGRRSGTACCPAPFAAHFLASAGRASGHGHPERYRLMQPFPSPWLPDRHGNVLGAIPRAQQASCWSWRTALSRCCAVHARAEQLSAAPEA